MWTTENVDLAGIEPACRPEKQYTSTRHVSFYKKTNKKGESPMHRYVVKETRCDISSPPPLPDITPYLKPTKERIKQTEVRACLSESGNFHEIRHLNRTHN